MQSSTSSSKIGFEESLVVNVIKSGKCVGCGTCVVVCPFDCLEYQNEEPVLVKECKVCSICAKVCPKYEWSMPELEKTVLGRERSATEEFGVHRRLAIAQASDNKILNVCQDGGIVTALLLYALESGLINGAVVSGVKAEKPFLSVPKLATTSKEILDCSGTRYFYSPSVFALAEGVKQKKTSIAFVGTPCQIRAVRKLQTAGLKKYTEPVKLLIGLMCSECFTYEGLMEKHIRETLGISLNSVKKMNIKGKMLVTTDSGVQTTPLAETKQYARKKCQPCDDFSSELADISLGGLGLDGWTFVVIRTEAGEELFNSAEKAGVLRTRLIEKDEFALNLLVKLSGKKRKSASMQFSAKN
jgi:coenzyme F420 hydrogenase subunit beta